MYVDVSIFATRSGSHFSKVGGWERGPARVVTGVFAGYFYVEEQDRFSGIRVVSNESVSEGDLAAVIGHLATSCERYIEAESVELTGTAPVPSPLGITGSRLGGAGSTFEPSIGYGVGPSTVGLLVKSWGRVVATDVDSSTIDDGRSQVRVVSEAAVSEGDYVTVTGHALYIRRVVRRQTGLKGVLD